MIFYKYVATCNKEYFDEIINSETPKHSRFGNEGMVSDLNNKYYNDYELDEKCLVAITQLRDGKIHYVGAFDTKKSSVSECILVIENRAPEVKVIKSEEITHEEFVRELTLANQNEWLFRSDDFIVRQLGIRIEAESYSIFDGPAYVLSEKIYSDKNADRKSVNKQLDDILASDSLRAEIDRIYSDENDKKFLGHPVHYLINAGDKGAADDIISILIPALLKNKRLIGGRVCDVDKIGAKAYREDNFYNIFKVGQGSTVIINLAVEGDVGRYANGYHDLLENIGKRLGEYGNDTLFIFVDVSGKRNISDDAIAALLANADMIQITEGYGDLKKSKAYLKRLAAKTEYKGYTIDDIVKYLPKDKTEYSVTDIYSAFNRWYGSGLKTHVYRAYKDQDIVKLEVKKKTAKPYEELQRMIGLADVKRVTDEIIANARIKRVRQTMGLENSATSMHMLFSGNPGTAKTTVARLISQILMDEEVLKNGHIVECGRQDLVGKYVGWTAKIVEEKFRAARGGILFIDEAYSLVEDHNSFGAEAINTIVQMMENYRDEVIVIFAGYPRKMQEFLDQNEGLRSRIAFHLNFPDYNGDELVEIMQLMIEQQGYKLESDAVLDKCLSICSAACKEPDFGNGRYVRNLLEQAILRQSNRIFAQKAGDELTKDDVITLKSEDFEVIGVKKQSKPYGFGGC